MALETYLGEVAQCIRQKNGPRLAPYLSIRGPAVPMIRAECAKRRNWRSLVQQNINPDRIPFWADIVEAYISCVCASTALGQYEDMEKMVKAFISFFTYEPETKGGPDQGWATSVLRVMLREFRFLAEQADAGSDKREHVEQAARQVTRMFARACADPGDDPLARGNAALTVAITLFRFYMQTNLTMCDNPRARIAQCFNDDDLNARFPRAEVVTVRYLMGYQLFYKGEYAAAAENFDYAFKHCLGSSFKNKQLILLYLVPLRLLQGVSPSLALLRKYNLTQYVDLVNAVKNGHVHKMNLALAKYETFFERRGLYLLLERIKLIAYRNLFRKVYVMHKDQCEKDPDPAKQNWSRVPLAKFSLALKFMQYDADIAEVECILANLIYKQFIRGYLSHQHKLMVVSKQGDPFPPITKARW